MGFVLNWDYLFEFVVFLDCCGGWVGVLLDVVGVVLFDVLFVGVFFVGVLFVGVCFDGVCFVVVFVVGVVLLCCGVGVLFDVVVCCFCGLIGVLGVMNCSFLMIRWLLFLRFLLII